MTLAGCSSPSHTTGTCDGPCPATPIRHLVVVVQENHTFETHFGRYCTGTPTPSASPIPCNDGPSCCEAGPDHDPSGALPVNLDDATHAHHDPSHLRECETEEIDGGKMDQFVTSTSCGDPGNFAYADPTIIKPYWDLAAQGALADRYFQPVIGQSSANDVYLTFARWLFDDDDDAPNAIGHECSFIQQQMEFSQPTIGDQLSAKGISWKWYAGGYDAMVKARAGGHCPEAPDDCAFGLSVSPCVFDPADIPMEYEQKFVDDPQHLADFSHFASDVERGKLPQVVFVKPIGYQSEHPGEGTTLSAGVAFVSGVVDQIARSSYSGDTLVLVTYDEGGGYFDHVAPPGPSATDGQPYGTRVPLLALGPFARSNYISHVVMEHSSIVKLIEWNWLGAVGQLQARDAVVANLGSLLIPSLGVPED